jgi:hypothetical protein
MRAPHAVRAPLADARRASGRSGRRRGLAPSLSALAALAILVWATCAQPAGAATLHARRAAGPLTRAGDAAAPGHLIGVAFDPLDPGPPVPQRFLGLSFEAGALGQLARYANRGDLVRLLRSLGSGVLRFGGITADQNVAWTDAATPRPAWASATIDAADLRAIGVLARRSGWRVLLTVGMAHYEPEAAAREVAAAHSALGPYLAAVEIGNEPDAYGRHGLREMPWIAQGYEEQVSAYREAIGALTPGVPIAGPDVTGPGVFAEWGAAEALAQTPALLTGHHYPLGCAQHPPPSIATLLSPFMRDREARSLATYLSVSRASGIPLRIDETNTVSCGGVAGISNAFASALWASTFIAQAMAAGASGINLQGNPSNCAGYTPLCAPDASALAAGRLRAEPEWYALLLASSLAGDRPLPTTVTDEGEPAGEPNLPVFSFMAPDHTVRVLLADDEPPGSAPLRIRLGVGPGVGSVSVLGLTAPSPTATGGVLLGGRAVAAKGSWLPAQRLPIVAAHAGLVSVVLAPGSAALLSTRPPAARGRRRRVRGR